eukprot:scaffold367315_cov37-Prasinocladus_malaysianus.AAC.2
MNYVRSTLALLHGKQYQKKFFDECLHDALGEGRAEAKLEIVDGDVVEDGVGAGQVDVLEDARVRLALHALLGQELAVLFRQKPKQHKEINHARRQSAQPKPRKQSSSVTYKMAKKRPKGELDANICQYFFAANNHQYSPRHVYRSPGYRQQTPIEHKNKGSKTISRGIIVATATTDETDIHTCNSKRESKKEGKTKGSSPYREQSLLDRQMPPNTPRHRKAFTG